MGNVLPDYNKRRVQTIVLCPNVGIIAERELKRGKIGYNNFIIESLYIEFMETTPRLGMWVNNSTETPAQTVEGILNLLSGE